MGTRTGPDDVLDAALACIARVGLSKTTLDDVAREVGCARATVYRLFPGKTPLLVTLVERETRRFAAQLVEQGRNATTLGDAVVSVVTHAARALTEHPALVFVAAYEPEVLLPHLTFDGEDRFLASCAELVFPAFTAFLSTEEAMRLTEWLARITLSYVCCPSERVDLFDASSVRALADDFVLPGFTNRYEVTSQ